MDWDVVERLIGLVERSRIIELDWETGGSRIRIVRGVGPLPSDGAPPPGPAAQPVSAARGSSVAPRGDATPPEAQPLRAGMSGTFFRSSAPGEPPFVAEGDIVAEGQTLAILEAMKTLNPVEADRAGRIAAILVGDGLTVEVGTPLFVLAPVR